METPQVIRNRYLIGDEIGAGGMGVVYRATDRLTGTDIALKRVTTSSSDLRFGSHDTASDFHLSLAREFQLLASLRHPNIISVLDYGFDESGQPFYTMELLEESRDITAGDIPYHEKINRLSQIFQALIYLHRRGILHRDLKPANALMVQNQVKLLDFGLSREIGKDVNYDATTSGTLAYMAPEVLAGDSSTPASDLYSVGIIAYQMFAGHMPFTLDDITTMIQQIMTGMFDVNAIDADDHLQFFVGRLLQRHPEDRYLSAQEALRALQEITDAPLLGLSSEVRESFLQAARFVGRNTEAERLATLVDATVNGTGASLLIGGESGVGKTRLLEETRAQALVSGAVVVKGQTVRDGSSRYTLWGAVLRQLILAVDLSDEDAAVVRALVPDVSTLLGRDIPDAPEMDPSSAQQRLLGVIEQVLRAQPEPVIIILEDLQWAKGSLHILEHINTYVTQLSVLILGSYRNDERPKLPEELPGMQHMTLQRLDRDAIAELGESMIGPAAEQTSVVDYLENETAGNVFFLVEVVRALAEESGNLEEIGHRTLPRQLLAKGIISILQRRLSHVPSEDQELLRFAAVYGRRLDPAPLRQLAPDADIDRWLLSGSEAVVLEVRDNIWQFAHDKLREQILTDIPADDLTTYHQQTAEAIEAVYGESPDQLAALAYHWSQTSNREKEIYYANLAGETALKNSANQEAARHFKQALDALLQLPEDEDRDRRELAIQLNRGVVLTALEGYTAPDVTATYTRAFKLSEQLGETAQFFPVLWGYFVSYFGRSMYDQALVRAEKTLALAEQAGDPESLISAHWAMGIVTACLGHFEDSEHHATQVCQLYDRNTHGSMLLTYGQDPLAASLAWLSLVQWYRGLPDTALETVQEAVAAAQAVDHPFSLGFALMFEGLIHLQREDANSLADARARQAALLEENEFPYFNIFILPLNAWEDKQNGNHEKAAEQYEQAIAILRGIPAPVLVSYLFGHLATCHLQNQQVEAGIEALNRAFAFVDELPEHMYDAEFYRLRGECHRLRGEETEAEQSFRRSLEIAQSQKADMWQLRTSTSLASLLADQGKRDEAHSLLEPVVSSIPQPCPDSEKAADLLKALST